LAVARALSQEFPKVTVVRNPRNLGYGGTKKKAYRYFIDNKFDAVVLIPGDLQYAPETISDLWEPLVRREADIVLGSRFLSDSSRSRMPLFKWIGNNLLTAAVNLWIRQRISDYHTGFRSYTCDGLRKIDIDSCPDGHDISMDIILRAIRQGLRIHDVAVPTFYTDESRSCSYWTSVKYAMCVFKLAWRHNRNMFMPKLDEPAKPAAAEPNAS
jgi:glycosyltransferase involved in cell wall biosynthesis